MIFQKSGWRQQGRELQNKLSDTPGEQSGGTHTGRIMNTETVRLAWRKQDTQPFVKTVSGGKGSENYFLK